MVEELEAPNVQGILDEIWEAPVPKKIQTAIID